MRSSSAVTHAFNPSSRIGGPSTSSVAGGTGSVPAGAGGSQLNMGTSSALEKHAFSTAGDLPAWRTAAPGLCIEGKCRNPDCAAYGRTTIHNAGFTTLDLVRDTRCCKCPMCHVSFQQVTGTALNNCEWTFRGYKLAYRGAEPERVDLGHWETAGNSFERFKDDPDDNTIWTSLKITTRHKPAGTTTAAVAAVPPAPAALPPPAPAALPAPAAARPRPRMWRPDETQAAGNWGLFGPPFAGQRLQMPQAQAQAPAQAQPQPRRWEPRTLPHVIHQPAPTSPPSPDTDRDLDGMMEILQRPPAPAGHQDAQMAQPQPQPHWWDQLQVSMQHAAAQAAPQVAAAVSETNTETPPAGTDVPPTSTAPLQHVLDGGPGPAAPVSQTSQIQCSICCSEPLNRFADSAIHTPCGHCFHKDCLRPWLAAGKTACPTCRRDIGCLAHVLVQPLRPLPAAAQPMWLRR